MIDVRMRARRCRRTLLGAGILAVASAAPASAQGGAYQGTVVVGRMEHRVDAGFGVGTSAGTVLGVAARVTRWQLVELDAHALGGRLDADSIARDDRTMGEVGLRASVMPLPWLALVAGATVRGYDTAPVAQRWTMLGAGAELRLGFADDRVETVVRTVLLPRVTVSGGAADPDFGFQSVAAVRLSHRRLQASLEYSLERFLFPTDPGSADRREQLAGLQLRLGARW